MPRSPFIRIIVGTELPSNCSLKLLMVSINKGIRQATLEVRESNLIARKLYQRFGFQVVGDRPRYYKDNDEDALIMTASGLDDQSLRWLESGGWQSQALQVMIDGRHTR